MITVKCIEKIRNKNGIITHYILADCNGIRQTLSSTQVKNMLKCGQLNILNLKLTSDDKLIDKQDSNINTADTELPAMALYDHNKIAFDNVMEHFKSSNRTAIIQPTGTGKSYVALQLIRFATTHRLRILHITSISTNLNYFKSLVNKYAPRADITYRLYAGIKNIANNKNAYDIIIIDEFHRAGASIWGKNLKTLLDNNSKAKILGMTATNIRYLDNMRDMAKELFNSDIANTITLQEALLEGILKSPDYVTCLYSYTKEFNEVERKVKSSNIPESDKERLQEIIDAARKQMINDNFKGVQSLFESYLKPNGKYIVFCSGIDHLDEVDTLLRNEWCKNINKNIEIYITVSGWDKNINLQYEQFSKSESDSLKFLLCVNMLNEGVHIQNIDGVIMMRSTVSGNIYMQQLGRAFSVDWSGRKPLILDIVNNFNNLKLLESSTREIVTKIQEEDANKSTETSVDKIENIFYIKNYAINLDNILNEIAQNISMSFDDWIRLCEEYMITENKYITSNTKYKGKHLGAWVKNQKKKYEQNLLTDEQVNALLKHKIFEGIRNLRSWDENYETLCRAINNGVKITQRTVYEGINIGTWFQNQRYLFKNGKLPEDKIQKLKDADLKLGTIHKSWDEYYNTLCKAINNGVKITQRTAYEGLNIGTWVNSQRMMFKKGKLSEDKIQKLKESGLELSIIHKSWDETYETLCKAINNGVKITDTTVYEGIKIGIWLNFQRKIFRRGKLPEDRVQKLKELGLELDPRIVVRPWDENYETLCKAINNGVKVTQKTVYEGIKIGSWVTTQRRLFKRGELPEDRIQKLKELGVVLDQREVSWNENYETLCRAINNGVKITETTVYEGANIGTWINTQRKNFKNGKLSEDRIEKLRKIGVIK